MNDPWHRIEGSIRGPDGERVSGATIGVTKSSVVLPEISLAADAGGDFNLMLPEGSFTLTAWSADNSLSCEYSFQVPGNPHPHLVLKPS